MKKSLVDQNQRDVPSQGPTGTLPPRNDQKQMQLQRAAMEEKLKQSQKQLQNFKVTTWGNNFYYMPLQTKELNSIFLKQNGDFNDCINMINEYNIEVLQARQKKREVQNGPWRSKFYNQLLGLLREVMFTKNRLLQKKFATKVHEWAEEQMMKAEITSKEKKRSTSTNQSMTNQILDQSTSNVTFNRPISAAINNSTTYIGRGESADPKHRHLNLTATTRPQSGILRPESGFIRPDSAFNKTDGEVAQTVRFLSDVPHVTQPSEIIQQVLRDYQNGHRTKHSDCDPPADRIQDYKRRVLSFDDPTSILQQPAIKQSDEIKYQFPKPILHKHETVIEESHTERKQEELMPPPGSIIPGAEGGDKPPGTVALNPDGTPVVPPPVVLGPDGQPIAPQPVVLGPDGQPIVPPEGAPAEEQGDGGEDGEDGEGPPPDAIEISPEEIEQGILMPEIKPYVRDDYGEDMFKRDLNKKFEVRSNYIYYEPSDDPREIAMEQQWLYNRNQEIADKRQEQEMIQHIKEWSTAKGKLNKEISRKIESAVYGSQFSMCEYKPKQHTAKELEEMDRRRIVERAQAQGPDESVIIPPMVIEPEQKNRDDSGVQRGEDDDQLDIEELNEAMGNTQKNNAGKLDGDDSFMQDLTRANIVDHSTVLPSIGKPQMQPQEKLFKGLEHAMNKQKVALARQMHGDLIGITQQTSDDDVANYTMLPSLSMYSKGKVHSAMRPFSAVFQKANHEIIKQEQLEEIEEIQNRMAKYKINVPIKQIMDSILVPDGIDPDQEGILPEPGFGLIENPFFKAGKKKKQKGKGKQQK